jgi:hypothetical protein
MFQITTNSPKERNALILSLVISLVIFYVCLYKGWQVGKAANNVDHLLYHTNAYLDALKSAVAAHKGAIR